MNTSSFLFGAALGAAATVWASKRKNGLMSAAGQAGSMLKFADLSKSKNDGTFPKSESKGSDATSLASSVKSSSHSSEAAHQTHSKDSNLSAIKDFIKGNPDVRREVEQILKETHTVIPGL
ncbi:hypothetical protein DCC85_12930 [Paenibacillus sp. CAA11]|uniref:hypothetical protein n=1 Tax=Paenibacillus sp. CAA11 TaxID=1532905 RepID=UPI000D3605F3|nr:hypothetical protein [Paenibacillus sp. CAA11]AWB45037.1 hypothetical protein DCC85_12930 [Paenibacillus sp. CAA11]